MVFRSTKVRGVLALLVIIATCCLVNMVYNHQLAALGNVLVKRYAGASESYQKVSVIDAAMKQHISEKLGSILAQMEAIGATSPLGAAPPHIEEVISHIKKMNPTIVETKSATKSANQEEKPDVCPEKYGYDQLDGDFPYFYKGFNMEKCTGVPQLSEILTVVYNFVGYSNENLGRLPDLLTSIGKVYPGVAVLAAIPTNYTLASYTNNNTVIVPMDTRVSEMDRWTKLISNVTTKYVFVGRDVVYFTWFDRLERLVREVHNLDAYVVASAIRGFISGHWTNGCEQSKLINYTLEYIHGYEMSKEECIFCDHVQGPFVSRTSVFKKFPLPSSVGGVSGFAMWFLTLVEQKKGIVSCPDAMAFVSDDSRLQAYSKQHWAGLAKNLQVETVQLNKTVIMRYDCEEANTSCTHTGGAGIAVSRCCRSVIMDAIKFVIGRCKEAGLACELRNETLLGAVKFNGLLPWRENVSIALHVNNFEAFEQKLKADLEKKGYTLTTHSKEKGYELAVQGWSIKVFTVSQTDTLRLAEGAATVIAYDGAYVTVPENPGLAAKTRFGSNLYRNWQGSADVWNDVSTNKFPKCARPGFHACLDRFVPDGNLL